MSAVAATDVAVTGVAGCHGGRDCYAGALQPGLALDEA